MRGGYRIIDFKKTSLTSGTQGTIEGLFASVSNPYKKPVMVSGLVVGDIEYPACYAVFIKNSNNFEAQVAVNGSTLSIVVTPNDGVTVTVTAGAATLNTTRAVKSKAL